MTGRQVESQQTALIIVDVQNDFLLGGALAVDRGDEVLLPIDRLARGESAGLVVATQDWHPPDHCSFLENGGSWPPHCIQNTVGAELHPIISSIAHRVIRKGENPRVEQYSGFAGTTLALMLHAEGYERVAVVGLATDYCVKATALDAIAAGFAVEIALDGCRAVDPVDGAAAVAEMLAAGVTRWP